MKLFRRSAKFVLVLALVLAPLKAAAAVEGQEQDQSNEVNNFTGCATVSTYGRGQSFKPTLTRALSIDTYLKDRIIGSQITLTLKKESDGSVVYTSSHSLTVDGEGWEPFSFDDPFVTVTPETSYAFYLSINDNQTKWCYSGDTYSRGESKGITGYDFVFMELGKQVNDPLASSNPDTPVSSDTGTTQTNTSSSTSKPSGQSTVEELGSTVSLTHVILNGTKIDSPVTGLELVKDDKLTVYGKSMANIEVEISYADQTVKAKSDRDGNWSSEIDLSNQGFGEISFYAKPLDSSSSKVEKKELFKFTLVEKAAISALSTSADNSINTANKQNSLIYIILILVLAILIAAGIYVYYRRKKLKGIVKEIEAKS